MPANEQFPQENTSGRVRRAADEINRIAKEAFFEGRSTVLDVSALLGNLSEEQKGEWRDSGLATEPVDDCTMPIDVREQPLGWSRADFSNDEFWKALPKREEDFEGYAEIVDAPGVDDTLDFYLRGTPEVVGILSDLEIEALRDPVIDGLSEAEIVRRFTIQSAVDQNTKDLRNGGTKA